MALFIFIAHEKDFELHEQLQTGAYSCSIYKRYHIITVLNSIELSHIHQMNNIFGAKLTPRIANAGDPPNTTALGTGEKKRRYWKTAVKTVIYN